MLSYPVEFTNLFFHVSEDQLYSLSQPREIHIALSSQPVHTGQPPSFIIALPAISESSFLLGYLAALSDYRAAGRLR